MCNVSFSHFLSFPIRLPCFWYPTLLLNSASSLFPPSCCTLILAVVCGWEVFPFLYSPFFFRHAFPPCVGGSSGKIMIITMIISFIEPNKSMQKVKQGDTSEVCWNTVLLQWWWWATSGGRSLITTNNSGFTHRCKPQPNHSLLTNPSQYLLFVCLPWPKSPRDF